jgi:serine/threonine-protein kinase
MTSEHFGRYIIKREIGRGGMSTVFHAFDPRFERDVAIKVLPPELVDTTRFRMRFEREAKVIASLEHAAIVPLYDFGEEDGAPYIVMRYMAGGSLADRLAQKILNPKEAAQLFNRLAPALDAAHAKGIIHRDLKPGNVLYDLYGNAFLSDFGIARLAPSGAATITVWTVLGTPAYMSPERMHGNREEDHRGDIYALGVILFQVLTGSLPYSSESMTKTMMMHVLDPVPDILGFNPNLPLAFKAITEKAMAKAPEDRYPTAGALAQAIELAAQGFLDYTPPFVAGETPEAASKEEVDTMILPDEAQEIPAVIQETAPEAAPKAAPEALARRPILPRIAWISGSVAFLVLLVAAVIFSRIANPGQNATPSAQASSAAIQAGESAVVAGESPVVYPTASVTPSAAPTIPPPLIGGANRLALLKAGDIWILDLNGNGLQQLTRDAAPKSALQWSPDGRSILFASQECIKSIDIQTFAMTNLACFDDAASLDSFSVSPDASRMAIGLNGEEVYFITYDVERLRQIDATDQLAGLSICTGSAPYRATQPYFMQWSPDGQRLAIGISTPWQNTPQDTIRVVDLGQCAGDPVAVGEFPIELFWLTMRGYYESPSLSGFAWDGEQVFVVNSALKENGFGDLHRFDVNSLRSERLEPLGACCYRDARWSPDERYLLFTYQDEETEAVELYYIPYAEIGRAVDFEPLRLPTDFLAGSDIPTLLALRTATGK